MSLFEETASRIQAQGAAGVAAGGVAQLQNLAGAREPVLASWATGAAGRVAGAPGAAIAATALRAATAAYQAFFNAESALFGGVSPKEARQLYQQLAAEKRAKKNLWRIEVSSPLNVQGLGMPEAFNFFATDVEYSPFIIEGEKIKVGGANVDNVTGNEAVEVSITTLDDAAGTLKKWFAAHHAAAAASDGTVAEPASYAITLKIIHAFATDRGARAQAHFECSGYFRTANISLSLSRRDDALEEVQMTFSQLDTFMRP